MSLEARPRWRIGPTDTAALESNGFSLLHGGLAMRGRHPAGPAYVDSLAGSEQAKKRLRIVLETMSGTLRVSEACAILEISEQRFYQLREELLQAALERLEGKPVGRPRRVLENDDAEHLREQVKELEEELEAAQVREQIALAMPKLMQPSAAPKKTKRRARPGWWKK